MTEKHHHTAEPSWRPLAQKLSGLIRHGSARTKKSSAAADEKSSLSRFKRQKKMPSSESTLTFKPLQVDLNALEGTRLSEGWLETDTRDADHGLIQQPPSAPKVSTTPIRDLFANKSVLDFPISGQPGQPDQSSSQKRGNTDRRPFSMVETRNMAYGRTSLDFTPTGDTYATGSILDRGRPIEPKRFVTDALPKVAASSRHSITPKVSTSAFETAAAMPRDMSLKTSQTSQYSGGRVSSVAAEQNVLSHSRPAKNLDTSNRHSMFAVVTPSPSSLSATAKATPTLRSASAMPLDRIHAWQKSITSAPTSAAAAGLTSGPGSASTSAVPSQADFPVRRASTRGVGNRLAWIKELEEKRSSSTKGDLGVLKKQAGSVSDKLALFESKQAQSASPVGRLPPVARSNSTTSRLSWAGLDSTSSANGNFTATPRTSIDTVRSSHRASSVMSYYDDSFREKMESVVGVQAADKDNPGLEDKQRVIARFVPVKPGKGEEKTQSCLADTGASTTATTATTAITAETSEKAPQLSRRQSGTGTTELDKADEELAASLSTTGLGKPEEEPRSVQEDTVTTAIDPETTESPSSSQLEASPSKPESEQEGKVETAAPPSQSEANLSIADPEKANKAEEGLEAGSSQPGLEKTEEKGQSAQLEPDVSAIRTEKGQSSQVEPDTSAIGTEKADEEQALPSFQVASDISMTEADKGEEKLEPTQPTSGSENLKTEEAHEEAPEEEKVSAHSPAEPQEGTVLANDLNVSNTV